MRTFWKTIWRKSGLLLAARVLSKGATIVVMVVVARRLGVSSFGELSALLAWTALVGLVTDFGLLLPTVRRLSRETGTEASIVSVSISARLGWGVLALAVFTVLAPIFGFRPMLAVLFAISSILETIGIAVIRSFEGRLEMGTITLFTVVERFVFGVVVTGAALIQGTVLSVAIGYLCSFFISLFIALRLFRRRFGRLTLRFTFEEFATQSKIGLPFLISAFFSLVFYKVDTIILAQFRPHHEVGIYNAAMRIIEAHSFVPLTLMASLFPTLSNLFHQKSQGFRGTFSQAVAVLLAEGVIVSVLFYLLAARLVTVLFSSAFDEAASALRILAWSQVFYSVFVILAHGLIAVNKEQLYTAAIVTCGILSIALNLVVIPQYGYTGAAWVRVGMEGVLCVFVGMLYVLQGRARVRPVADITSAFIKEP